MSTTKPNPHASCSSAGSYRPWASGPPVCPNVRSILTYRGETPTAVPAPCAGALYPLRKPESPPRGHLRSSSVRLRIGTDCESGLKAPATAVRPACPAGRPIAIDFATPPRRGSAGRRAEAICQEVRIVATDAPWPRYADRQPSLFHAPETRRPAPGSKARATPGPEHGPGRRVGVPGAPSRDSVSGPAKPDAALVLRIHAGLHSVRPGLPGPARWRIRLQADQPGRDACSALAEHREQVESAAVRGLGRP